MANCVDCGQPDTWPHVSWAGVARDVVLCFRHARLEEQLVRARLGSVVTALRRQGILRVEDTALMSDRLLLGLRNVGPRTLGRLRAEVPFQGEGNLAQGEITAVRCPNCGFPLVLPTRRGIEPLDTPP
jgi:hypothetical protein